jgi:hypothetical protein
MDDRFRKRLFQKVKSMTQHQFDLMMVNLFDNHYDLAQGHYREAMEIELEPKQRARVEAKAKEIKEVWDGIY